ncbi:MAG: hypothetical protein PHE78_01610 [Candidatus Gastranaerophilales bacterium]|nr:hypothetical protein [Candidatus Gastranaerophilales bacterium]
MSEIGAIDAFPGFSSIFQLNVSRVSVNPFASVDEMSDVNQTDAQVNPFTKPEELIEAFNLYDPKNRLKILSLFSSSQKEQAVGLLGKEGLQLGLKFFDKEKIMNLLFGTSQQDISKVVMAIMPLQKAFEVIPQKILTQFILAKEQNKENFMKAFANYSVEELQKLIGNLTGIPQKNKSQQAMIAMLDKIPFEAMQPMLASVNPEQKINLVAHMTGANNELFDLFPKSELMRPLATMEKEETLKGFTNLDKDVMAGMVSSLPEQLIPLVLTLIPVEKLAKALIEKYPDVISQALALQAETPSAFS